MTGRPLSVLVLCTGDLPARSFGEAMLGVLGLGVLGLGTLGDTRIVAHSAGSKPIAIGLMRGST